MWNNIEKLKVGIKTEQEIDTPQDVQIKTEVSILEYVKSDLDVLGNCDNIEKLNEEDQSVRQEEHFLKDDIHIDCGYTEILKEQTYKNQKFLGVDQSFMKESIPHDVYLKSENKCTEISTRDIPIESTTSPSIKHDQGFVKENNDVTLDDYMVISLEDESVNIDHLSQVIQDIKTNYSKEIVDIEDNEEQIEAELTTSIQMSEVLLNAVFDKQKCTYCNYKTKNAANLNRHILTHSDSDDALKEIHKCPDCSYETPLKWNLARHLLVHKSKCEVELFHCPYCSLQTKHGRNINKHIMMSHPDMYTGEKYSCKVCKFVTKTERNLTKHVFTVHQKEKEPNMLQCPQCPFKTRIKFYLEKHILRHQNPVEKKKFKCPHCPYESILKTTLENHVLTHKKPWEVDMFKCLSCPYETKSKKNINRHLHEKHKFPKEPIVYKCPSCHYESKRSPTLKKHIRLKHKNLKQCRFCQYCAYISNKKKEFEQHMASDHKDKEIKVFKCKERNCLFQTKRRINLNLHVLNMHTDKNKLEMLVCDECDYQTPMKHYMTKHKKMNHVISS